MLFDKVVTEKGPIQPIKTKKESSSDNSEKFTFVEPNPEFD